jgi:hypothetical protein
LGFIQQRAGERYSIHAMTSPGVAYKVFAAMTVWLYF